MLSHGTVGAAGILVGIKILSLAFLLDFATLFTQHRRHHGGSAIPTNNALVVNFLLSSDAKKMLISTD